MDGAAGRADGMVKEARVAECVAPSLRVAGLFAGIGGLELGLKRAGHTTALLCEVDTAAKAVLRQRFPDVEVREDVRDLKEFPTEVDLVAAGFPCQDLSQAGTMAGITGEKSGLVENVWRLLGQREIPWVLLENVPFMLRLQRGKALDVIVTSLEALGYKWAYRVVDSRAFGVPQRRERVYILASLAGDPRDVLLADDEGVPSEPVTPSAFGFYWTEGNRGVGWAVDAIPPLKGGSGWGIASPPAIFIPPETFIKPHICDAERLQGFPREWTRAAVEAAGRGYRWKLVGNAVTVNVARWIGSRLARPGRFDTAKSRELPLGERWPNAAWGDGSGRRYTASVSAWPKHRKRPSLVEFLRYPGEPLSYGAANGFLTRARAAERNGALRFEPGFLDALARHVRRVADDRPSVKRRDSQHGTQVLSRAR